MKLFYIAIPWLLLATGAAFSCTESSEKSREPQAARIVSLSGFITELLYELGYGDQIVGRDATSTYPAATANIPNLGHISQLNTEAILALAPDYVLLEEVQLTQQSDLFRQLDGAGIRVVATPTAPTLNNAVRAARTLAQDLEINPTAIDQLEQAITGDSLQLAAALQAYRDQPKVLFIYARGTGRLLAGGRNTPAAAIIEKAGGRNALQSFEGYRALTPEALVEAAPDVILMFTTGLASLDGKAGLTQITGIAQTPAYQNDRIVAMDGHYLTAFGPRAAKAATDLAARIHLNESL